MNNKELNRIFENSLLFQFIGEDGYKELKSKIIEVIVDDVKEAIMDSGKYVVDIESITEEISDEIKKEISKEIELEYKTQIKKIIKEKLGF